MTTSRRIGTTTAAACFFAVYAIPLFWPPGPVPMGVVPPVDPGLLERTFPGTPSWWLLLRISALFVSALLIAFPALPLPMPELDSSPQGSWSGSTSRMRCLSVAAAVVLVAGIPFAPQLTAGGQIAYLVFLILPTLVLWCGEARVHSLAQCLGTYGPPVVVAGVWTALRLSTDLFSTRVAEIDDGWVGWPIMQEFLASDGNVLTDLAAGLPWVGSTMWFFLGLPFLEVSNRPLSLEWIQGFQIGWHAFAAIAVGGFAVRFAGRAGGALATAVLLFAPFTRFATIFPGPFVLGPVYGVVLLALTERWLDKRSPSALAGLGAMAGLGLLFPGTIPIVAFCGIRSFRSILSATRHDWLPFAVGCAGLLASVIPAAPKVFFATDPRAHDRWEGLIEMIDPYQLGQISVHWLTEYPGRPHPADMLFAAPIAPFAHPRVASRLWGDAIFDPLGAGLAAVGLASCLLGFRSSVQGRYLVYLFVVSLIPALLSPTNIVDICHSVCIAVPIALLAAVGFRVTTSRLGVRRSRIIAGGWVAAAVAALGGSALFDYVNPTILGRSFVGIAIEALRPQDAYRAVILNDEFLLDEKWNAAVSGPEPIDCLTSGGDTFTGSALRESRKEVVFWSPSSERDRNVSAVLCELWPDAELFEIWDDPHISRVFAGHLSGADWKPRLPVIRWQAASCDRFAPSLP